MLGALTENYAARIDCAMSTAEEIKNFRKGRGWSQSDLAEQLGVDQATVSRIERGGAMAGPVSKLLEKLMSEPAPEPEASAA